MPGSWAMIKCMLLYGPVAVSVVAFLAYVLPLKAKWWAKIAWTAFFAFSGLKFIAFSHWGGNMFNPYFPEPVAFFWCFACDMTVYIALLSVVWWLKWHRGTVIAVAAALLSAWGLWNGFCTPRVVELTLEYDNLPRSLEGYRIIHISDFHTCRGITTWRTERTVDLANSLKADLICLTGDFLDGLVKTRPEDLKPFARLRAKDGVWAVTGNHEFYNNLPKWEKAFEENGINLLANRCVLPREGLAVGGVHDRDAAIPYRKLPKSYYPAVRTAFADAKRGEFRLLMQHRPQLADEYAAELGVRLQLSGHTHGGVTPVMEPFVAEKNGGFVKGLYPLQGKCGNAFLYVTAGAGVWGGLPARLFNPSEIALITLRGK